jgi:glutamate synthase (NADPH/NADH) large chain
MQPMGYPSSQGLYDPRFEHDACGVGFVVDIKGRRSHAIVRDALTVLINLDHRGARGSEANTGDGAGLLLQLPHAFFADVCDFALPEPGSYGVGMLFLPPDAAARAACEAHLAALIAEEGQTLLGWRTVPTDSRTLGETAKAVEPHVRQLFVAAAPDLGPLAFERKLYVIRKRAEQEIRHGQTLPDGHFFYATSFSARTIVYKGMLTPLQVEEFYPELGDPRLESALALVHSRFSTNTFPSWERAHPNRYLIHNGEINTLRGNVNWMHAREGQLASALFGDDLPKLMPIIDEDGSDSTMIDNCFEFLTLSGRSLAHTAMMMIPEPWANHEGMSAEKKAFYEYHSCLMEPWDGPASIAFTDGVQVGAVLDRNGLRPSRYYVTADGRVIMASEVGVLDLPPDQVVKKGRLQPGRMLLIDTQAGRIITDAEIKHELACVHPYRKWLDGALVPIDKLPAPAHVPVSDHATILHRQQAFGYTYEDLRFVLGPMSLEGIEPLGSMGADIPLAVLSERPQLLYNYFKQLFAQVTNPPIDSLREEIVTSMITHIGPERNLLDPTPRSARQIKLHTPILTNDELAQLQSLDQPDHKAVTLPILFTAADGVDGLQQAMDTLRAQASQAIADGATILILSDRGVDAEQVPIPALLAVAGVHHHLVREETRTRIGLILESGEPREVHHFALLIGYGAGAINPYLAYESLDDMIRQGLLPDTTHATAVKKYIKAASKGVVKTMSKMGISTVQSYRGAQIFEALGVNKAVVDEYFAGTPSRIEGIDLATIAEEALRRHAAAFPTRGPVSPVLDSGGDYQWRKDGEYHLFNPESVYLLQSSSRTNDYALYKEYARLINEQTQRLCTLRGLLDFTPRTPVPLDEVEPIEAIVARFKTGAMSYGSISQEAHEAMAIAMNRLGGKSNTGEGGEDPERFCAMENGDSRCSKIKQVASGRFGVTSHYLVNAIEIQIKMAQGAKPGEGGQLPGTKVYPWVAKVRHSTPGVGLISPPPHHDIYSIEDLAELIHDLKNANPKARISVKLVSEVGVGTIAAGVAKAHADLVLISGYDGGTGASPRSSIRHAGLPWELGLAETHQTLLLNNLRSRITVETDGKLLTGRDVVIGALLGAEEFGFATAPLIVLGCVMMRVCHLDTCPVGVATQNPALRKKFSGDPAHVVNLLRNIAQEVREYMAQLGFRTFDEMVGAVECLEPRQAVTHWKAKGLDLTPLLYRPQVGPEVGAYCQTTQDHGLEKSLDMQTLLALCRPALERQEQVTATVPIRNVNRVVGTLLGSEISRRYGGDGLPEDTIQLTLQGSAGQSFGAFVPKGVTLTLVGDANDYLGKGLSGGKIIVYPPAESLFVPEENILIGNVAFYGATGGEAYIRGMAGERFCVRNSGVRAVVEAVGDHGCEYMTGGRVVVLGHTGRNFAAGMTGGIAYVLDEVGDFPTRCNRDMVLLERMGDGAERDDVREMIHRHAHLTQSDVAWRVLARWEELAGQFVKVIPKDYQRVLQAMDRVLSAGLSGEEAVMAAFEENKRDVSRVGGN